MTIIIEKCHVSPPPATIGNKSLQLTFFDVLWLNFSPIHTLFFFDLPITKTHFIETIVPKLKQSLSTTLQHFFPFVGNLVLFPTNLTRMPEIRYAEGDSVEVTFAECNLDFDEVSGNQPRKCDKFYNLVAFLGNTTKVDDYVSIPVFSVQVTLFPNCGISIGMTNHHSLCDASTRFCFLKAWTTIARYGSNETFLANGTLPVFDRLVKYPKLDESYLKAAKVETFNQEYQLPRISSGPTDKVRATFILARRVINGLKELVSTQLPTLAHVSSFTIACAYSWNCIAKLHNNKNEVGLFAFAIDCRSRMDPPIPSAYFGNCIMLCLTIAKANVVTEKEGFVTAVKLIGEKLHKMLTDKNGVVRDIEPFADMFRDGIPTMSIGVNGTPKLKFYELDFGFGKPKKHETILIDLPGSISMSMSASKGSNEDLEIGMCLLATEIDDFIRIFNDGLKEYI